MTDMGEVLFETIPLLGIGILTCPFLDVFNVFVRR